MKDLDFDELDRAVNSLMADVKPDGSQPSEGQKEKTVSITPDEGPPSPSNTVIYPSPTPPAARPTTLPARRGGRFMDVVHPSHDMKPAQPQKVSREGTPVAPTSPASETAEEPSTPSDAPAVEEEKKPDTTPDSPAITPPKSDWPDPIDLMSQPESTQHPEGEAVTKDADKPEATAPESGEPEPLTSPFLPDAKVEKRPLGGQATGSIAMSPTADDSKEESKTVDNPDDQLPPTPKETDQPLPAELQNDLVAIESGSSGVVPATPASPEEPLKEEPKPPVEGPKKEAEGRDKKEEPLSFTGPTSIPQQYKEEPSSASEQTGTIYDTDTYHQPLAHPAKKKSGWMWVIWILLIIVLGGAIGAALYFFGII